VERSGCTPIRLQEQSRARRKPAVNGKASEILGTLDGLDGFAGENGAALGIDPQKDRFLADRGFVMERIPPDMGLVAIEAHQSRCRLGASSRDPQGI